MVELTFTEFEDFINASRTTMQNQLDAYRCVAALQGGFGFRLVEASEIERWTIANTPLGREMRIQLAKGEMFRQVNISGSEYDIVEFYYNIGSFPNYFSRAGYLNRVKRSLPRLITNGDSNKILTHSYRYYWFKYWKNQGLTIPEIAIKMGHESEGSTYQYVFDPVFLLT